MTATKKAAGFRVRTVLTWLFAAGLVAAAAATGLFSGLKNTGGLVFLLLGITTAALMSFSPREIGTAFRHASGAPGSIEGLRRSARVWEAAARNAWIIGVLGSALGFTAVLGGGSGGIQETSLGMARAFIVALYGLILAVACLVPALKLAGAAGRLPSDDRPDLIRPALPVSSERLGRSSS